MNAPRRDMERGRDVYNSIVERGPTFRRAAADGPALGLFGTVPVDVHYARYTSFGSADERVSEDLLTVGDFGNLSIVRDRVQGMLDSVREGYGAMIDGAKGLAGTLAGYASVVSESLDKGVTELSYFLNGMPLEVAQERFEARQRQKEALEF